MIPPETSLRPGPIAVDGHAGKAAGGEGRDMKKTNVAIFLFEDVEVLDFAGPFEVFSRHGYIFLKNYGKH
jgi:hypothetical protein